MLISFELAVFKISVIYKSNRITKLQRKYCKIFNIKYCAVSESVDEGIIVNELNIKRDHRGAMRVSRCRRDWFDSGEQNYLHLAALAMQSAALSYTTQLPMSQIKIKSVERRISTSGLTLATLLSAG